MRAYREEVAFRTVADDPAVARRGGRPRNTSGRTSSGHPPTRELMIELYDVVRERFWIEVRRDPTARAFFENGGLAFPKGSNGAPLIYGYEKYPKAIWDELRLSLDHIEPKAQGQGWRRSVDPTNLRFLIARDNTMIAALEKWEPIMMWFRDAPE